MLFCNFKENYIERYIRKVTNLELSTTSLGKEVTHQ